MTCITRLGHAAGLCNRIDVIALGFVYTTSIAPSELEIQWPLNLEMPAHFRDLFTDLPGARVVEKPLEPEAVSRLSAIYRILPPDYRHSVAYRSALHRLIACVVPAVQHEVEKFKSAYFPACSMARIIGVHVRRCEGAHISPFAQPLRYYEAMMKQHPRETRFFVSTDSQPAFRWLNERFGDRVFQRNKPINNRDTVEGVLEGFVDMLLLSQCDSLIGTHHSSFSATAAVVGGRQVAIVKGWPHLPEGRDNFSVLRWLWAYRHFLRESTFWRRTWRYAIVRSPLAGLLRELKHHVAAYLF